MNKKITISTIIICTLFINGCDNKKDLTEEKLNYKERVLTKKINKDSKILNKIKTDYKKKFNNKKTLIDIKKSGEYIRGKKDKYIKEIKKIEERIKSSKLKKNKVLEDKKAYKNRNKGWRDYVDMGTRKVSQTANKVGTATKDYVKNYFKRTWKESKEQYNLEQQKKREQEQLQKK